MRRLSIAFEADGIQALYCVCLCIVFERSYIGFEMSLPTAIRSDTVIVTLSRSCHNTFDGHLILKVSSCYLLCILVYLARTP